MTKCGSMSRRGGWWLLALGLGFAVGGARAGAILDAWAAAGYTQDYLDTQFVENFESYTLGTTLADNGWTLSASGISTIVTPTGTGNTSDKAVQLSPDTTRVVTRSPDLSNLPTFQLGDTIFLSAEIRKVGASSGACIGFRNAANQDVTFVRIVDTSVDWFAARAPAGQIYGDSEGAEVATRGVWYEVLLVMELHPTDITLSTGSLFQRRLDAASSALIPVADVQGVNLGFTETQNPMSMSFIRVDNTRGSAEWDNIRLGVVIPEPASAGLLIGGAALLVAARSRRRAPR